MKDNIKQKLTELKRSDSINKLLNSEYKKIEKACLKKMNAKDYSLEKIFLVSNCIETKLYQYGRNLK